MSESINYSKSELQRKFDNIIDETLGDIDINGAFEKTNNHPKVTGIAGDVIEKSVLGYDSNSNQEPDIVVDNQKTEVKTTGIRYSTKSLKNKNRTNKDFEAKEPMSITAVSPNKIVKEIFEKSNFWHKLEHLLLVYYHYDAEKAVKSWDYKNFKIKGYEFHEFSKDEEEVLKSDWQKVQNFIKDAQDNFEDPTARYPFLGSELRKDLLFIDTSPKWPNRPRFRLKRSAVTTIVQQFFGKKFEKLSKKYDSAEDIDQRLHEMTIKYKGKKISELLQELAINYKLNKKGDVSKNSTEQIVVKMFGGKSKKLNQIDLFKKANITLKTMVQTIEGKRTEDTKLFPIDFERLSSENKFEESEFYEYFSEKQFIVIIFQEPTSEAKLLDNSFVGFKRISFDDYFIQDQVKYVWKHTRYLVAKNLLKEEEILDKKSGKARINKNGVKQTRLNFLKSKQHPVFLRGSGADSSKKPLVVNGIKMYTQYVWIKGSMLVSLLSREKFI